MLIKTNIFIERNSMSEYKKLKLFYLNIKKTYSEIKGQIEYKKKIVH